MIDEHCSSSPCGLGGFLPSQNQQFRIDIFMNKNKNEVVFPQERLLNLNFANNSAGSCAVTAELIVLKRKQERRSAHNIPSSRFFPQGFLHLVHLPPNRNTVTERT